jgi:hypothetical protein
MMNKLAMETFDVFKPVMSSMKLEKLPPFASAIRKRHAGMSTFYSMPCLARTAFKTFPYFVPGPLRGWSSKASQRSRNRLYGAV